MMRELIEELFVPALANPQLDTGADAVSLPIPADQELVVTTDGFTVQPLEFPGGNIGSLAVHGTVNDLAVSGAVPRFMTLSVFLEEGLEIALLRRVIDALAGAARDCGVAVVAGDTKVVGRGDCDGIYLAATGVGFRPRGVSLCAQTACAPAIAFWSAARSATTAPRSCWRARNSACAVILDRMLPACCRRRRL